MGEEESHAKRRIEELERQLDDGIVPVAREATDTIAIREALLEAEARYRALLEGASVAVTLRDIDTQTFLDCNSAALRLFGYATREELRGTTPLDLAPAMQPDGRSSEAVLAEYVARALREGAARMSWRSLRRSGEPFDADIRSAIVVVGGGRRILQTMIEDVTDKRRDELALHERARRDDLVSRVSRQFVQASNDLAVPFALEALGSFLHASRVRLQIFSDDRRTLATVEHWAAPGVLAFPTALHDSSALLVRWVGKHIASHGFVVVPDVAALPADVVAALERPSPLVRAFLILPLSNDAGLAGWIVIEDVERARPWSDEDVYAARLVGEIVAVGRARAEAEARLRRQAARDELLRDASRRFLNDDPDSAIDATLELLGTRLDLERASLFALDEATRRLRCTHRWAGRSADPGAFESLEGYPGPPVDEAAGGQTSQAAAERWCEEIQRDSGKRDRHALVGYGGRLFGLLTTRAREGRVLGADEGATLAPLGELIAVARLRSATEATLARAKEDAEAASRMKSAFLANMSHELRTPLNGVIGMFDLLSATPLGARQRRYVEVARSSASLLLSVINDVLDFSKIEAGKLDVASVPFAIEDVLDDVERILSQPAEEKGLSLTIEVGSALDGFFVGDPARIRQVLVNLVANAVRFTRSGGVTVRASVVNTTAAPERAVVRFEVEDTGVGIPREGQRRLFQPFTQLDASTTRVHGGTGLGLAICRELVQRMSGTIGVTSEEGDGSTFWFELPLAHAAAGPNASPAERAPAEPPRRGSGLRRELPRADVAEGEGGAAESPAEASSATLANVLVVEDSPVNAEVAREILTGAGYKVDVATDGGAAVEAVGARSYDVILMDCQLPGVDGYEASRRIRAAGHTMPIIALTASVTTEDLERCFASGMTDHVPKPVDARRLLGAIADHLDAGGAPRPPKRPTVPPVADLSRALDRLRGDTSLLRRLAQHFAKVVPDARAALRSAVERRDATALRFAAHRLRGQAASFDGTALVAATTALQDAGQRENWTAAGAALLAVEMEIDRLLRALVAYGQ